MTFTSVHVGKYSTEDKIKTALQKLNTTEKKQTTQNTAERNWPGWVASCDSRPGNEVGIFYKAPDKNSVWYNAWLHAQRSSRTFLYTEPCYTNLTLPVTLVYYLHHSFVSIIVQTQQLCMQPLHNVATNYAWQYICYSAYMLSPVRLSHGWISQNGWSQDHEIFTMR